MDVSKISITAICVLLSLVRCFEISFETIAPYTKTQEPGPAATPSAIASLPWEESYFTKTVASVQNAYCSSEFNQIGMQIGDQTLLNSITYQGNDSMRVNIYHSQSLGIILAYMGTNGKSIASVLIDVDLLLVEPDEALGIPSNVRVGQGWQQQWNNSWPQVESALEDILQTYQNVSIQVIGHSQGAAVAQLAALAINKSFPQKIDRVVGYGCPRVGNADYAQAFDSIFKGRYTDVTNGADPVWYYVPRLGYTHPSGVVWINPANSTNYFYYVDGEDNGPSHSLPEYFSPASVQRFPYVDLSDHEGIYMHSSLGGTSNEYGDGPCPAEIGGY